MNLGADQGSALLAALAGMNGYAHPLLGIVVVGADLEMIQEIQKLMAVAAQALNRPLGLPVRPRRVEELIELSMELRQDKL